VRPQLGERDELVVVDDDSTDDTARLARAGGARVVSTGGAPPAGWTGKCWACHTGAAATDAPLLLFLDADVTLAPGAVERLVAAVQHDGGLVSVQPWHRTRRAYEQCSLPFNLVAVMGTGVCSPWAGSVRGRFAYGPVLATSRDDYEEAGGHAAPSVRGSVVEDIALARRYEGRVTVGLGRALAEFRMYPGGLGQLIGGWRKNIAAGAGAAPWWAVALTVGWLWSVIGAPATGWAWWASSAAQLAWFGRRVGRWHPLAYVVAPVLVVLFLIVLAWSVLSRWRGATQWRGRAVPLR
jgi:4,4'-diaponeurosporenoate glycosyltransferase